jgi:hypothetical protein
MADLLKSGLEAIATADRPIIKHGGRSSSDQLSRMVDNITSDIIQLYTTASDQSDDLSLANRLFSSQVQTLGNIIETLRESIYGYNQFLIDSATSGLLRSLVGFYTNDFVISSGTTAEINNNYGQVTLPILHTYEKLVSEDLRGNRFIPKETRIAYTTTTSAYPTDDSEYIDDINTTKALDGRGDTAWTIDVVSEDLLWIKVRIPDSLNTNKLINSIYVNPYPTLLHNLCGIWYKIPGGTWQSTNGLTYQEGYRLNIDNPVAGETSGVVQAAGNIRVLFTPVQSSEILFAFQVKGKIFGFYEVGAQYLDFQKEGTLEVDFSTFMDDFSGSTLTTVLLSGKDPSSLNTSVQKTIDGETATFNLVQTVPVGSTPLITTVESRYN